MMKKNEICMQCGKCRKPEFYLLEEHEDNTEEESYFCSKQCLFDYIDDFKKEEEG